MTLSMLLKVLTPDELVLETSVDSMRVQLPDGWWGILPGHAPLISKIDSGVVKYRTAGDTRFIALYQGTVEVRKLSESQTEVLILTAAAEEGSDLHEAQAALMQQAARLEEVAREANLEFNQMKLALEKSLQESELMGLG